MYRVGGKKKLGEPTLAVHPSQITSTDEKDNPPKVIPYAAASEMIAARYHELNQRAPY